ncbi:MAG: hypothetical protein PUD91_07895 [Bacteroidales bacterium]|nr:hypothetical protein [Bacteroidales bacterium]
MNKSEMAIQVVKELGYKPIIDNDGDVFFRVQLKGFYILGTRNDNDLISVHFPQFWDIEEGEDVKYLAACNKLTRELKLVKTFIDDSLKSVSASCEFYCTDMESMRNNIEHSIKILCIIRSIFRRTLNELS